NCDSPGGAGYGDVMDQAFEEALLSDPRFEDWADLRTTRHQPALARTLEACYAAWRANGNAERPERPRVVITDWHDVTSLPDIQITTEALTAWGMDIEFADPRKLELDGDTLVKDSRPVDLVYKRAITKELVQEPDAQALLTAYEAGTVCMVNSPRSPIVGNKKIMAVIQEPSILSRLSPAQRAAVKRFLPWTAILREGKTTIQGYKVDLGEFVRHNKDKLVLKPAQSYGGKDVYLGQDTEEEAWQRLVDENIGDNTWVVQEMVKIPKELFPVIEEDEVTMRLLNVNINPFVFGGTFAGAYTRISRSNVINVASGGGIVPTKTIEPLDDGEL
ncbi:MAG: circularly permuted type 2 ATP-grasp protein, partial [Candidatus Thermoplasmatota archaeon]|nr:circularly permuted type 2 ATP-grasp protein [Candidatus Thermoplasmatota archaeon]